MRLNPVADVFFQFASKWSKWCAQTLHPFFQIFNFFRAILAPIVAPPSENFENCSISWKGLFFRKKRCKYHLNRPTNADAMSFGSNSTCTKAVGGRRALFSKIYIYILETNAMTTSSQCDTGRTCLSLTIVTTEKNLACLYTLLRKSQ